MEAAVKAVSVAAPSAGDSPSTASMPKSIRSSDLGGTRSKKGLASICVQRRVIDLAGGGEGAVFIHRRAAVALHPVVDRRIAGAGVESQHRSPLI